MVCLGNQRFRLHPGEISPQGLCQAIQNCKADVMAIGLVLPPGVAKTGDQEAGAILPIGILLRRKQIHHRST